MDKLGWEEGEPIEHSMISKSIENAQKKVEGRNFDIRKHLLRYDDVLNTQRDIVYKQRREILEGGESLREMLFSSSEDVVREAVGSYLAERDDRPESDFSELSEALGRIFGTQVDITVSGKAGSDAITDEVVDKLIVAYQEKEEQIGSENLTQIERYVMLQHIDYLWKDHLLNMDHLREGVGLRGYAQKDPLREYTREGFDMFTLMMDKFKMDVCVNLFRIQPASEEQIQELERERELEEKKMVLGPGRRFRRKGQDPDQENSEKSRSKRPMPLRERQEVQKVLRSVIISVIVFGIRCFNGGENLHSQGQSLSFLSSLYRAFRGRGNLPFRLFRRSGPDCAWRARSGSFGSKETVSGKK